jgi:hypothetical protein
MIDRGAVLPASVRGSDIPSAGKTAPPYSFEEIRELMRNSALCQADLAATPSSEYPSSELRGVGARSAVKSLILRYRIKTWPRMSLL